MLSRKKKKTVFVTCGDVLRLISWRSTLFWIVFLFFSAYPPQVTAWGQASFTVWQALWISRAPTHRFSSCCYNKCPQGGSTSSCFTQVPGAAGALAKVLFLGCRLEWTEPWLESHDFFPPYPAPPEKSQALPKLHSWVLWCSGGATPRKLAAGGNPHREV